MKRQALPRTPLTEVEQRIAKKLQGVRFSPYSASKRFARDMKELSDRGRAFMAYIAYRYRSQCRYTPEEVIWIDTWLDWSKKASTAPDDAALEQLPRKQSVYGIAKKMTLELEKLPLHSHAAIVTMMKVGLEHRQLEGINGT